MILTVDTFNLITLLCLKPLCAIGLCVYLLRSNPMRSAAKNNWLVFLGVLSPALVVAGYGVLPSFGIPLVPDAWMKQAVIDVNSLVNREGAGLSLLVCAVAVFILAMSWGVIYLLNGVAEIHRLTKRAVACTDKKSILALAESMRAMDVNTCVDLKVSSDIRSPVMWGLFKPTILLPVESEGWEEGVLQRVLAHELAHIKRGDWPVKISVHVLCCLFWFVVPVWWLAKKHEWFAELACDDMVVQALDCRAEYANDLLHFATHENQASIATLGFMKKSELYLRINAVLDGAKLRSSVTKKEKIVLLLVWVALLLPMTVAQALPKASESRIAAVEYFPVWLPAGAGENTVKKTASLFATEKAKVLTLDELQQHFVTAPQQERANETMLILASRGAVSEWAEPKNTYKSTPNSTPKSASKSAIALPDEQKLGQDLERELEQRPQVRLEGFLPINLVSPSYPTRAIRRGIEGRVEVQFDINTQGKAVNVRVIRSEGRGVFDKAVLNALAQSQFQPIRVNGHPIITKNVKETFLFTLASAQ